MGNQDFEFYVGGIEDSILQLLKGEMQPLGVKDFATYSGELDAENLKRSISESSSRFPLVLVSYAEGDDTQLPKLSSVFGESLTYRHDCQFSVVCVTDDARGTLAQRRGALNGAKKCGIYTMLSKVREALSGLQLSISVERAIALFGETLFAENEAETSGEILLTYSPLQPLGNQFIARLPGITAYAVPFETYFKWSTKDRTLNGTPVSEIILGVDSRNAPSRSNGNYPGVGNKSS